MTLQSRVLCAVEHALGLYHFFLRVHKTMSQSEVSIAMLPGDSSINSPNRKRRIGEAGKSMACIVVCTRPRVLAIIFHARASIGDREGVCF